MDNERRMRDKAEQELLSLSYNGSHLDRNGSHMDRRSPSPSPLRSRNQSPVRRIHSPAPTDDFDTILDELRAARNLNRAVSLV